MLFYKVNSIEKGSDIFMKVFKTIKQDPLIRSIVVLLLSYLIAKLYLIFIREPVMAMNGHLLLKFLVSIVPSFVFLLVIIFSTLDFVVGLAKLFVEKFFIEKEIKTVNKNMKDGGKCIKH